MVLLTISGTGEPLTNFSKRYKNDRQGFEYVELDEEGNIAWYDPVDTEGSLRQNQTQVT